MGIGSRFKKAVKSVAAPVQHVAAPVAAPIVAPVQRVVAPVIQTASPIYDRTLGTKYGQAALFAATQVAPVSAGVNFALPQVRPALGAIKSTGPYSYGLTKKTRIAAGSTGLLLTAHRSLPARRDE